MSIRQYDSGLTSNDLLESLAADRAPAALNDQMVAQSVAYVQNIDTPNADVQNIENAPAVSLGALTAPGW